MIKGKNNSTISILIGLIIILSISTGYLAFDKYKQNQISKSIREYHCIKPEKLCALVEYKYTDKLEVKLELIPGQYYFQDETLKLFDEFLSNWKKNIDKKDDGFDTGEFLVENFIDSLAKSKGDFYIVFEDSDKFEIIQLKLELSDKTNDTANGIFTRMTTINKNGIRIMKSYGFKKDIELDNYKRISSMDIRWLGIIEDLPEK